MSLTSMEIISKMITLCILLGSFGLYVLAADPSTRVVLPQGILTGLRMQTERRVVVTAYLGIPYALSPLGPYRFAPPERHPGWNDSLIAEHFRPDCLQPRIEGNIRTTSEDCLYLNVFVPASGSVSAFPVVVFIEGQDYVTGSARNVEGQELAAEGVIVVTLSYRLNVFGFLSLGDANSRGNLGILDQYLALLWVRENIQYFGGRNDITLMGHGAGGSSIVTHMTSPRTQGLFSKAIIMSGSVFSPILKSDSVFSASRSIMRSLGCVTDSLPSGDSIVPLTCLRQKPAEDVLKAFENTHKNGNWTSQLVPVADAFLPERMQYLPLVPQDALKTGKFLDIPILTGTTSNEGTVLLDRWSDLGTQTESSVLHFINHTAIPNLMRATGLPVKQLSSILEWRYLNSLPGPRLNQLLHLYTDAAFLAPHWKQIQYFSQNSQPVFVYRFSQNKEANAGGFGSDLPFLFGPLRKDQWQARTGRNQATFAEERLSLRMKRLWTTFIRTGDPNPSVANGTRIWPPFSWDSEAILELFGDPVSGRTMDLPPDNPDKSVQVFWNELLPTMSEQVTQLAAAPDVFVPSFGDCGPYRSAMFTTLFFLVLLIACLILALILLKRHLAGRQLTKL